MKSKEYWEGRFIELQRSQLKRADSFAHELEDLHARMQKEIEDDITVWHKKVATANGISMADAKKLMSRKDRKEFQWTLEEYEQHAKADLLSGVTSANVMNASANWHLSYLDGMKLQLEHHVDKLYKNIDSKTRNHFKESLNENYLNTAFELQKGIGIGEKMEVPYDERKLENILRTPWASDGKNFSQRIWRDRTQLVNNLQKNLSESVIRGDSDTDMIQALSKDEKRAEFNTRRLVETESAYFDSLSEQECCEDFGIEKYRFLAVLDMKTSDICQELDNKVFLEKDRQVGVNAPPMHPFCRSTTAPVIDEEFLTSRRAKNPKTGEYDEIPPEMNYKQWKEKYVEGKENAEEVKQEQVQTESSKETERGYKLEVPAKEINTSEGETVYKETAVSPKIKNLETSINFENQNNKVEMKKDVEEKISKFRNENKKSATDYLENYFHIPTVDLDFDSNTISATKECFIKLDNEIIKVIGKHIDISTIQTISSKENLFNIILKDYIEKNPSLKENIVIEQLQEELGLTTNAVASYFQLGTVDKLIDEKKRGIYLNREKIKRINNFTQEEIEVFLAYNYKKHPVNYLKPHGIINHEIGHALDDFLDLSKNAVQNGILKLYEDDLNRYNSGDSNFLSIYSFADEGRFKDDKYNPERFQEFIAEAICDYLTSLNPSDTAKNVWDIVADELRNRY